MRLKLGIDCSSQNLSRNRKQALCSIHVLAPTSASCVFMLQLSPQPYVCAVKVSYSHLLDVVNATDMVAFVCKTA